MEDYGDECGSELKLADIETALSSDVDTLAAYVSPAWLGRLDTNGKYQIPPHIRHLDRLLIKLADGEITRLAVMMPPRHGKSMLCSRYFPAWFLGRFPDERIILASYESDFAARWGRAARDVLERRGESLFGVTVRQDSRASNRWEIKGHSGGMDTAGVGAAVTGKGADVLIIEDPVKNAMDALSPTKRRSAMDWWLSTAQTRLEPNGRVVMIGTRWHQQDLIGLVLDNEPDKWHTVRFPAIAEEEDEIGRKPGDALWPERFPVEALEQIFKAYDSDEAALGPYWKQALYDQNPVPPEGAVFKRQWFNYYDEDGEHFLLPGLNGDRDAVRKDLCTRLISVDLAVSTEEQADYFCAGVWAFDQRRKRLMLEEVIHERIEGPDQPGAIVNLYERTKPYIVYVESNAYQLSLVQDLLRKGLRVKGVPAKGDKVARATGAATRFAAETVYFRKGAPWVRDMEEELTNFPGAKHDDYVDMVTLAINELSKLVQPKVF